MNFKFFLNIFTEYLLAISYKQLDIRILVKINHHPMKLILQKGFNCRWNFVRWQQICESNPTFDGLEV